MDHGGASSQISSVRLTACRVGARGAEFEGLLHNAASVTSHFNVSVLMQDRVGRLVDEVSMYKKDVPPGRTVAINGMGLASAQALPKKIKCEVENIRRIESDL